MAMHNVDAYACLTPLEQQLFDALRPFAHRQYSKVHESAAVHEAAAEAAEVLLAVGALRGNVKQKDSGVYLLSCNSTFSRGSHKITMEFEVDDLGAQSALYRLIEHLTGTTMLPPACTPE